MRVAKICGNIKSGEGGNESRFPAWARAPHDGAIGHSGVSGFVVAGPRWGRGCFSWPASARPATKTESAQPTARTPRRGVPTFGAANRTRKRVENSEFCRKSQNLAFPGRLGSVFRVLGVLGAKIGKNGRHMVKRRLRTAVVCSPAFRLGSKTHAEAWTTYKEETGLG